MENTRKNQISIMNMNIDFYYPESYLKRKTSDIAELLLKENPTFIALQEFGCQSTTGDVNGNDLQKILESNGYKMLKPQIDGKNPVNTRLFYKANKITLVKELPPIYQNDAGYFRNRQCGGTFQVGEKIVNIYSLHVPHLNGNEQEKEEFWNCIIDYAKRNQEGNIIFAGDFNENKLESDPTELARKITELEQYFTEASIQDPTWEYKKLDHIFVSSSLVNNMIIHSPIENTISDHKGLFAEFVLF